MDLVSIGTIIKTSGTAGAVLLADALPGVYLPASVPVSIGYTASFAEHYTLQAEFCVSKQKPLLRLEQVDSQAAAAKLIEKAVFVDKRYILEANPGYVFEGDVLDCEVLDYSSGERLGTIIEVWYLPANDVWLMRSATGDIPLPVIDDVIIKTDFQNKKIWINLLDGLTEIAINES